MVYNYKNRALNLGILKATDYKHNKHINMPEPESLDIETLHQFRRTECMRIFDRAQKSVAKSIPSKSPPTPAGSKNVSESGRSKNDSIVTNPESNLSREELLGLKSL